MNEKERSAESSEGPRKNQPTEGQVDAAKRAFIGKFGKYAAVGSAGLQMLMSPEASARVASGSGIFWEGRIMHRGYADVKIVGTPGNLTVKTEFHLKGKVRPFYIAYRILEDGRVELYKNGKLKSTTTMETLVKERRPELLYVILEKLGWF